MKLTMILGLGAVLLAALALPAVAREAPKDYAGKWTLSGVSEGDAACTLTLTSEQAIGGWAVDLPRDCVDKFAVAEDAAAWTLVPGGAIAFIDPLRHVVLKFDPTAIGGYVAHPAGAEPIALDRARPHHLRDLAGRHLHGQHLAAHRAARDDQAKGEPSTATTTKTSTSIKVKPA